MPSVGHITGAGCAIKVGTLSPGISTETSLALTDTWKNKVYKSEGQDSELPIILWIASNIS